ncbi:hypothetical protein DPMN_015021 [Dreissena polymorpha]|uniref:Uncharacterized protein n=1 Tax=Dreissena polymorpha TaxID=45954 RepID=A0A9D4N718_DREPO|nr:hypothetical protein DPMN_015021 [Dreissena polymorpha]
MSRSHESVIKKALGLSVLKGTGQAVKSYPSTVKQPEQSLSLVKSYPSTVKQHEQSLKLPSTVKQPEQSLSLVKSYPSTVKQPEQSLSLVKSYPVHCKAACPINQSDQELPCPL